jgi:hypothetical protein
MKLPDNARLGSTLYFKSPSLGEMMFVDVDVTPDDYGAVELLPEGITELTGRWCVALNRTRKVKDFRPATREEVATYVQRRQSVDQERASARPTQRLTRAASPPRAVPANGVRDRLREFSSRYLGMPRRALAALRSSSRSRLSERRPASERRSVFQRSSYRHDTAGNGAAASQGSYSAPPTKSGPEPSARRL